jgi:hypothetical protein
MNLIDIIDAETQKLGYRTDAIRRNYSYSDVWSTPTSTRSVPFAAFTQTPPSYRSAAFAVIEAPESEAAVSVREHRALGAPLFFVIEAKGVSTWQVYATKQPRFLGRFSPEALPAYFHERKDTWAPDAIHRAKSIGRVDTSYQLDFIDIGLIPAIEGEIHTKLDRLIREAVAGTREFTRDESIRVLFRGVFRLLAAKILMDRQHPRALAWDSNNVRSVLSAMGNYYTLGNDSQAWPRAALAALKPVWETFRSGFNVANISADDLAYVYETTLVTDNARAEFGTHSTPRHVADYIVGRLKLWEYGASPPRVYEPFTGAGVFLGSALRHMRDGLPHAWSDKQRHDLLVKHIGGAEIDPFAAEVAKLSLILADYPNANGWRIDEVDLFQRDALAARIDGANVILCNPPFGAFEPKERAAYPEASRTSLSKALFALETSLRAAPDMLGFVVPNTVLVDRRYREQRREIERGYSEIEMVALPDGVFNVSQANTALLIARGRLKPGQSQRIRSGDVADQDKRLFAATGQLSHVRETLRENAINADGAIWLFPLQSLWDELADLPKLGAFLHGHWGLRWKSGQKARAHHDPGPGRVRGFKDTTDLHQFVLSAPVWLDAKPEELLAGGNLNWDEPKILCNATRLSRGYWRLAAAADRSGFWATQQFMGLWPQPSHPNADLDALAAVINGPIVHAFLSERSFDKRFRITTLADAPIPAALPAELGALSRDYSVLAATGTADQVKLTKLLKAVDEAVLKAYGLTAAQKQDLLSAIGDDERPLIGQTTKRRNIRSAVKGSINSEGRNGWPFDKAEAAFDNGEGLGEEISAEEGRRRLRAFAKTVPVSHWAGELVSEQDLRGRYHLSKAEIDTWKAGAGVVTLLNDAGEIAFPVEQFVNGRPVKGLGEIVEKIGNPRVAWMWLRQPHAVFEARQPLEVLKSGRARDVLQAAARDFR